jgi:hypothetical protein
VKPKTDAIKEKSVLFFGFERVEAAEETLGTKVTNKGKEAFKKQLRENKIKNEQKVEAEQQARKIVEEQEVTAFEELMSRQQQEKVMLEEYSYRMVAKAIVLTTLSSSNPYQHGAATILYSNESNNVNNLYVRWFVDAAMSHIAKLTSLRELYLNDTKITDAAMPHIAKLTSLKFVFTHCTTIK